jgi:hypothetical protein
VYLSGGLDALAEAHGSNDPAQQQAEGQLPADASYLLYPLTDVQHVVTATHRNGVGVFLRASTDEAMLARCPLSGHQQNTRESFLFSGTQ